MANPTKSAGAVLSSSAPPATEAAKAGTNPVLDVVTGLTSQREGPRVVDPGMVDSDVVPVDFSMRTRAPVAHESMPLEMERVTVDIPVPEQTQKYWIGTTSESPYQTIYLGGQDFPLFIEELVDSKEHSGTTDRYKRLGKTIALTDAQVQAIKEDLKKRVIRKEGARAYILDTSDINYKRGPRDIPLAAYVYMVKVKEHMPTDWREYEPQVMATPAVK